MLLNMSYLNSPVVHWSRSALVNVMVMAWRRIGAQPLSKPRLGLTFSFKKMRSKILSAKCQPSFPGSDELTGNMVCQPGSHYFDYYYGILSVDKINLNKSIEYVAPVDFISKFLIFKRVADIMTGYRGSSSSDGYQVTCPNEWSSTWSMWKITFSLRWRHNEHDGVSDHQPHDCLLKRLFKRWSKKTWNLRVTGLCEGIHRWPVNSPHKGIITRKMFPFHDVIMFIMLTKFHVKMITQRSFKMLS